jgi:hypothetical protein
MKRLFQTCHIGAVRRICRVAGEAYLVGGLTQLGIVTRAVDVMTGGTGYIRIEGVFRCLRINVAFV